MVPVEALLGIVQCGIDVALVNQLARCRRIGAQRVFEIAEIVPEGPRLPVHDKAGGRFRRILLALRDNADEVTFGDDGHDAGNIGYRIAID